jgi:Spy/CpxP family protein refolding chaperone
MTLHGKTRLKIWLVLAGVFAIGIVTGAALDGVYRTRAGGGRGRGGERKHEKMFEETRRELNLNDEQAAKAKVILDETRNEFRALHEEMRPRFDAVRQRARARMRETLKPEQQTKFDQMMARRDQKMRAREQDKTRNDE